MTFRSPYDREFEREQEIENEAYQRGVNNILCKIRAEINGMYRVILRGTPKDDWAVRWNDCVDEVLQIIDKYRNEVNHETDN